MSTERYWQTKEYAEDIHKYLREKERKRFLFRGQSLQISMRKNLVLWLKSVAEKMGFCTLVKHLAVYLLDIFMDNHNCQVNHLKIVALGCLNVAVKLEEEVQAPRNSDYNAMLGNQYTLGEFVRVEMTILKFYKCRLLFITIAHYIDYYTLYAISPSDTTEGKPVHDAESLKVHVQKYINYFLDMTLLDTVYYKFRPSIVASACILSTRTCLSLSPPWPLTLQNVTLYRYEDIKPCMDIMLRTINTQPEVNISSLYVTPPNPVASIEESS